MFKLGKNNIKKLVANISRVRPEGEKPWGFLGGPKCEVCGQNSHIVKQAQQCPYCGRWVGTVEFMLGRHDCWDQEFGCCKICGKFIRAHLEDNRNTPNGEKSQKLEIEGKKEKEYSTTIILSNPEGIEKASSFKNTKLWKGLKNALTIVESYAEGVMYDSEASSEDLAYITIDKKIELKRGKVEFKSLVSDHKISVLDYRIEGNVKEERKTGFLSKEITWKSFTVTVSGIKGAMARFLWSLRPLIHSYANKGTIISPANWCRVPGYEFEPYKEEKDRQKKILKLAMEKGGIISLERACLEADLDISETRLVLDDCVDSDLADKVQGRNIYVFRDLLEINNKKEKQIIDLFIEKHGELKIGDIIHHLNLSSREAEEFLNHLTRCGIIDEQRITEGAIVYIMSGI